MYVVMKTSVCAEAVQMQHLSLRVLRREDLSYGVFWPCDNAELVMCSEVGRFQV